MSSVPSLVTATSGSLVQARKRVLSQYRDWIRAAPEIVDMYRLEVSPRTLRERIRQEYEKHRYVRNLSIIDVLLFKGRIEYEETLNFWKQKSHVMRFFSNEAYDSNKKAGDFLGKFYEGTKQ